VDEVRRRLVTDAMTSGGLLVAIDPQRAGEIPGAVIGRLTVGPAGEIEVF
jgi:selenide,water dikinase